MPPDPLAGGPSYAGDLAAVRGRSNWSIYLKCSATNSSWAVESGRAGLLTHYLLEGDAQAELRRADAGNDARQGRAGGNRDPVPTTQCCRRLPSASERDALIEAFSSQPGGASGWCNPSTHWVVRCLDDPGRVLWARLDVPTAPRPITPDALPCWRLVAALHDFWGTGALQYQMSQNRNSKRLGRF